MATDYWFNDLPVLGKLSPEQAAIKLHEVGELDAAKALEVDEVKRMFEKF